mmetsp:Transcript_4515/g.8246  ORF Transcript_4515/g.8246 Transcript_4515/m.8246 type:complete len:205 (-) Transcript_4515:563-1177(-)
MVTEQLESRSNFCILSLSMAPASEPVETLAACAAADTAPKGPPTAPAPKEAPMEAPPEPNPWAQKEDAMGGAPATGPAKGPPKHAAPGPGIAQAVASQRAGCCFMGIWIVISRLKPVPMDRMPMTVDTALPCCNAAARSCSVSVWLMVTPCWVTMASKYFLRHLPPSQRCRCCGTLPGPSCCTNVPCEVQSKTMLRGSSQLLVW